MLGLLDWLHAPSPERGIHVAESNSGWRYTSYLDMARRAGSVAALLRDREVPASSVVSLVLSNPEDFVAGFFGCLAAGCTPSPVATPTSFGETTYTEHLGAILRAASPTIVLADEPVQAVVDGACAAAGQRALPIELARDHLDDADASRSRLGSTALLQFTSGSSGTPKAVRIAARSLEDNVNGIRNWLGWGPDDSFATWLPLFHDMGLIGAMITPVVSSTELWIMTPMQFLRAPERWLECFGRHGATITTAPSFGYAYVGRKVRERHLVGLDFSTWRIAISGAERIDVHALGEVSMLLGPYGFKPTALVGAYGLAEATLAVTGVPPSRGTRTVELGPDPLGPGDRVAPIGTGLLGVGRHSEGGWLASCGTTLPGMTVRIVDESGRALPDGHFGEIHVRGPSVADGYRLADGALVDFGPDGLATGDAGFLLDGELFVVGRTGDSLKVRGKKVFAEDVEVKVAGVAGVRPGKCAAVFGSSRGVDIAAVVVEDRGTAWVDEVVTILTSVTSPAVRVAVFRGDRGAIRRTSSGKPRRRVLWRQLLEGAPDWELVWRSAPPDDGVAPWDAPRPHELIGEPS